MDEYIITCLVDVWNACSEIEQFFDGQPKLYEAFKNDTLRIRAVERNVEIMGEAIRRIREKDPSFEIPNGQAIIWTRNRVIHGYDSVTTEFLWSLVINHIPKLKEDVKFLLKDSPIAEQL